MHPIFMVSVGGSLLMATFAVVMRQGDKSGYNKVRFKFFGCEFGAEK